MPPTGLKPGLWSWNPSLLEPQFRELARGLTFLVPFWDQAEGTVQLSQLRDVAVGHEVSDFPSVSSGLPPDWEIGPHGIGVGYGTNAEHGIVYDTFKGFTDGAAEGSVFMLLNEHGSAIDNGWMATANINLLW